MSDSTESDAAQDADIPLDVKEKAKSMSFMDCTIHDAVASSEQVSIYLVNGIKLQGIPIGYDATSILLTRDRNSKPFAIERSAVATFVPASADMKSQSREYGMAKGAPTRGASGAPSKV